MERMKKKLLIVFLIMLSLVLGYQAYSMASDGCGKTLVNKSKTPFSAVFDGASHWVYCREHGNPFGFTGESGRTYTYSCLYESEFNNDGMAYFLHKSQEKGYAQIVQSFIWNNSSNANGGTIMNSTNIGQYAAYFNSTASEETELGQYQVSDNGMNVEGIRIVDFEAALNDPTVYIVDEFSERFFSADDNTVVADPDEMEGEEVEDETTEQDVITYEDYKYLYQLSYLYNHMCNLEANGEEITAEKLLDHIENYKADEMGTVYYKDDIGIQYVVGSNTINGQTVTSAEIEKVNSYGATVDVFTCDFADGRRNVCLWAPSGTVSVDGNTRTYTVLYYSDGAGVGVKKFDDSLFLYGTSNTQKETILNLYIELFNNTAKELPQLGGYGHQGLQSVIDTYDLQNFNSNPRMFYTIINEIYNNTNTRVEERAKGLQSELDLGQNVWNYYITKDEETNKEYVTLNFDKGLINNARLYDFIMKKGLMEQWINDFKLNNNDAKVSINVDDNSYIIGPFELYYHTVKLGGDTLVGIQEDSFYVSLNGNKITNYDLVCSNSNATMPVAGEEFYIRISAEDYKLTKKDSLKVHATYEYWGELTSTVHFLHAKNDDGTYQGFDPTKYSKDHPQRLMTVTTDLKESTKPAETGVTPDYYDFEIIKVSSVKEGEEEQTLKGAEYAVFAKYVPEYGSAIFVDVRDRSTYYEASYNGMTRTYDVLDNVQEGNLESNDDGIIIIPDVIGKITLNVDGTEVVYNLESIVAKETKAPEGFILDPTQFEISKNGDETARAVRTNTPNLSYDMTIKKVDDKDEPIKDLEFRYWFLNLSEDEVYQETIYTAKTNEEGIATFDCKYDENGNEIENATGIKLDNDENDLIAMIIQENGIQNGTKTEYEYFRRIQIIYTPKVENGEVKIEYFNYDSENPGTSELEKVWGELIASYTDNWDKNVKNGVSKVKDADGKDLTDEEKTKYVQCGTSDNIDIKIVNDKKEPEYSLILNKIDENGLSDYLKGTKFEVSIEKDGEEAFFEEVEIKDQGIGQIEKLNVDGQNLKLFLKETKILNGFDDKTALTSKTWVLTYNITEENKVEIVEVNSAVLDPIESITDGEEAKTTNNNLNINLTVINETEEYALKFRKVDKNGNPLKGALFALIEKDEAGNEYQLGTAGTDDNGYMTFRGLDKTGDVTLYLFELAAAPGYDFSNATRENPVKIEYTYNPGSNKLTNITIEHEEEVIRTDDELLMEENQNEDIVFNLRELNEIWELENKENPYDIELFTKINRKDEIIPGAKFEVSIYDENGVFAKYGDNEENIEKILLESDKDTGKVEIQNVLTYGDFYVEIKEIAVDGKYKVLEDTLRFSYTIKAGDAEVTWGDILEILDDDGNVEKIYQKPEGGTAYQDSNKQNYENVKVQGSDIYVINDDKPYTLIINKTNGLGENLENVKFTALIFKNLTSERQEFTEATDGFTCKTDEDGNLRIEGINIYSTPESEEENRERLTLVLTETVPEGHKWHKYGEITYTIDYTKFDFSDEINIIADVVVSTRVTDAFGNKEIKFLQIIPKEEFELNNTKTDKDGEHTVSIENTPVYDLKIFDKKVLRTGEEETEIKSGIRFTAQVLNSKDELLMDNVRVTFNENGIIAKDIDTIKEFVNDDDKVVEGLKLVLTEENSLGLEPILPITVIYDCKYEEGKFNTTITAFEYDGKTYEYPSEDTRDLIDGIIYVVDGENILVNKNPVKDVETPEIGFAKYDTDEKPISGITFTGKIIQANNENIYQEFEVTTGIDDNDESEDTGKAIVQLEDIFSDEVRVEIYSEKWANEHVQENKGYKPLSFIEETITISGIKIVETETDDKIIKTIDYSNATVSVSEEHQDKVSINETTMQIEIINEPLEYALPIIKTDELISGDIAIDLDELKNLDEETLANVMFDISIKEVGESDDEAQVFSNLSTDKDGLLLIDGIEKFGDDLVLTIEEISGIPGYQMLNDKIEIHYSATVDANQKITLTFGDVVYNDYVDQDTLQILQDMLGNSVINIENTEEYNITLEKKMNVNGSLQDAQEEVIFKGIVTTDKDLKLEIVNGSGEKVEKTISELSYDELYTYVSNNPDVELENARIFDGETTDGLYEIDKLGYYDETVYVYFVEELTTDNSSMTQINDVMWAAFVQNDTNATAQDTSSDKVYIDNSDTLNIKVTVENDAAAYKLKVKKVSTLDKNTPINLADAKFQFTLREFGETGTTVKSVDTAVVSFNSSGKIDAENSTYGEYIVGATLVEEYDESNKLVNRHIVLDVNKFGNLQLEIKELNAPINYIANNDILVVPYTAEPGKITYSEDNENNTSSILDVIVLDGELSMEVTLPNPPEPYDITICKVITDDVDNKTEENTEAADSLDQIEFDINFFGSDYTRIMTNRQRKYMVETSENIVIDDVDVFEEFYMTVQETDASEDIVKVEGIHVFKITATEEDKITSITYVGTGNIEDDVLKITGDKSYEKYFDTKDEEGDINRLEIGNESVQDYYIDLTKIDDSTQREGLEGAEFKVYLTKPDDNYLIESNLLEKDTYVTDGDVDGDGDIDGKINIGPLKYIGNYKLTIIEETPPEGMKKTFEKVEVFYETKDGYELKIEKVLVDGVEVSNDEVVEYTNTNYASLKLTIKNTELNPIPLSIYKVYYEDKNGDGLNQEEERQPLRNVTFTGVVRDENGNEYPFVDKTTNSMGEVKLGEFRVDGTVEITLTELSAPAGFNLIPTSTITLKVNNEERKIEDYDVGTSSVEEITENNELVIVNTPIINPTISLSGFVWKEGTVGFKEYDTYTAEGYATDGLFDEKYDELVPNIIVRLYEKDKQDAIDWVETDVNGAYIFDELDPFKKYYITFEYDGTQYEDVQYLVYGTKYNEQTQELEPQSYGSIAGAMEDLNSWKVNSKAMANSDDNNESIATTIASSSTKNIQYYPVYNQFTIDYEGETLYIKDGKYTTTKTETEVEFMPLEPEHNYINFGIKEKDNFDLMLSKDVESMKVTLENGRGMTYKYGKKPDYMMYTLELSREDIDLIKNIEITYKITVTNEDLEAGRLTQIAEYYNSDMLTPNKAWIEKLDGTTPECTISAGTVFENKDMIPVQTYTSADRKYSKDTPANTGKVIISNGNYLEELEPNETVNVYISYNYTERFINDLKNNNDTRDTKGDQYITLGIAEIYASIGNNGRTDKDSNDDSLDKSFESLNTFYESDSTYYTALEENVREDDADTAPAAKIVVGESKKVIRGNVFEEISGNNELNAEDTLIQGITVALHYADGQIAYETTTDENGYYEFKNIAAGEYYITFTYGDKNTVLPAAEGKDIEETLDGIKYMRLNSKSYNAFEFEDIASPFEGSTSQDPYWYKATETRNSDATDDVGSRKTADSALNSNNLPIEINGEDSAYDYAVDNEKAEQLYSYYGDTSLPTVQNYIKTLSDNAVFAQTPNFVIEMENTIYDVVDYSETQTGEPRLSAEDNDNMIPNSTIAENIDFGIKARPQSNIKVEKVVDNIKIYTSSTNPTVDISWDEDGNAIGIINRVMKSNAGNGNRGHITIQRSEEEIAEAILEITYKITVKNEANEDIIVTLADYVQNGMNYDAKMNEGEKYGVWTNANFDEYTDDNGGTLNNQVDGVKINNNINLSDINTILTQHVELNNDNDSNYTATRYITLTKTLNSYSETDIDEYENYVEVIQTVSKDFARKDEDSIPGNYDPNLKETIPGNLGKIVTTTVNGLEKDSSAAETISIGSEWGGDRQTYYILIFAIIAVFATGVILIQKKVLDK